MNVKKSMAQFNTTQMRVRPYRVAQVFEAAHRRLVQIFAKSMPIIVFSPLVQRATTVPLAVTRSFLFHLRGRHHGIRKHP
jgi:hypothetical protein